MNCKYVTILGSLASNSEFIYAHTNFESQNTWIAFTSSFFAILSPVRKASYLALLFDTEKSSLKAFSIFSWVGLSRTIPILDPSRFVNPSTKSFQTEIFQPSSFKFSSLKTKPDRVNARIKSTTTCPNIFIQGLYSMSNLLRSIAYLANLPEHSVFCKIWHSGALV